MSSAFRALDYKKFAPPIRRGLAGNRKRHEGCDPKLSHMTPRRSALS
jgi:hypothetical protein